MNFSTLKINMERLESKYQTRDSYKAILRSLDNKQAYIELKIEYMDYGQKTFDIPATHDEDVINVAKVRMEQLLKRIESDIADIEKVCGITK